MIPIKDEAKSHLLRGSFLVFGADLISRVEKSCTYYTRMRSSSELYDTYFGQYLFMKTTEWFNCGLTAIANIDINA